MSRQRQATVGAAWVGKTRDGDTYITTKADVPFTVEPGSWELVLFKNDKKGNDQAPDFRLVLSEQQARNGTGGSRQADDFGDKPGDPDPFA